MPDESPGFLHFGKKDDEPESAPKKPPEEEHHGLLDLFEKKEEPPPPPPPAEEHHGLLDLFEKKEEPPPPPPKEEHHGLLGLFEKKEEPPPPPPKEEHHGLLDVFEKKEEPKPAAAPKKDGGSWAERLFRRAPVTPEPASPQRPQILRNHSVRSALYIGGFLCLLAGIVPGLLPDGYRFYGLIAGGALLIGGILLTGDWHPLSGMFGLRRVKMPTTTVGVAALLVQHEAKEAIEKVTKAEEPEAKRVAPWHWPWSEKAREAEQAKAFTHVGLFGKILMGTMAAVMAYGANTIVLQAARPDDLSEVASLAHWVILLLAIALILFIIITRIRTFRHHWLSPFGILRRLLVFLVVTAVVALGAAILTKDPVLGRGYGEAIGGLVGMLAVLF